MQATAAPIKVGVVCSCSGVFGPSFQAELDVYRAWVDTVNAAGGVSGHPVRLTVEDDGANPGTSVTDAQTLIQSHVDAILDLSGDDETWATAVQQANVPVVGGIVTETTYFTNPDFYPEGQTDDFAGYATIDTAKLAGATNFAYVYCAEAPICAEGVPLLRHDGAALGVPDTYNAAIAASAPDYTAQCLAAQQRHASAVFLGDASAIIERFGADCNRQGYHPIYLEGGEGFGMILASAPGIKDNLWMQYPNLPFWANTPAVRAMNTALDKYYPGLRTNDTTYTEAAASSWPSGLLLADAVRAGGLTITGTPSPAEIVKGLESLHDDTLNGWAPPLTFTAGQKHHIPCWFIGRLRNGVLSLVNDGRVSCTSSTS